jgi:hypothetical protein
MVNYVWLSNIPMVYKLLGTAFELVFALILLNWLWNRSREMDR